MGKVTVSIELAKFLDSFLNERKFSKEELLEMHIKNNRIWEGENELDGMLALDLAKILNNGYEAEKTPKEEAAEYIEKLKKSFEDSESSLTKWRIIGAVNVYEILTGEKY